MGDVPKGSSLTTRDVSGGLRTIMGGTKYPSLGTSMSSVAMSRPSFRIDAARSLTLSYWTAFWIGPRVVFLSNPFPRERDFA